MKTSEELNALKAEVGTLNKKPAELNEDVLVQVIGGVEFGLTSEYDGEFPPTEESMPSL